MAWMTLSWLLGLDRADDYAQWDKVMKINFMVLITLAALRSKLHIVAFVWVCTLSIALLGVKGGIFTILTGGAHKVWGPDGSFIGDNNHFALALIMTIPLLRFLQMLLASRLGQLLMTGTMILVAAAALGSHSRGALLAIGAMTAMLWWRSRSKVLGFFMIGFIGYGLITFMPDEWTTRMETIGTYEEDQSATGRLVAWRMAWNAAFHHPFGVGFNAARAELFAAYSPDSTVGAPVAHSIYFQMLGQHGFVGLGLFLLLWFSTWRWATALRKEAAGIPEAHWCVDLAGMCQVALVGYLVGGAFLNLAHYDMPYNIMAIVVLTRIWVRRRSWTTEAAYRPRRRWLAIPGVASPDLAGRRA
jgi:probable O-glycosylation ligase (exosortase A-associated)